jgi:dTDP-4-dehydrorhamnose 3,5-epimerase
MEFVKTNFEGVYILCPLVHEDGRGFFLESFSAREMSAYKLPTNFVQDNHAYSKEAGILRGLHFQKPPMAQSKLVRVVRGKVFDVIVDLRKNSKTFGRWFGIELSSENKKMLFIPKGFAHGYCTLSPDTEFLYKVDEYYSPSHDCGILWNDPFIGINWPIKNPILSEKDKRLPLLKETDIPF